MKRIAQSRIERLAEILAAIVVMVSVLLLARYHEIKSEPPPRVEVAAADNQITQLEMAMHHADATELGNALRTAASRGYVPIVMKLLASHTDPNSAGPGGQTALMDVAGAPHSAEIARLLIKAGACVEMEDHHGHTALWYALREPDKALAAVLCH